MTGSQAPSGQDLFIDALRFEDSGRPFEALQRYEDLLNHHPAYADAWHNRGLLLARLGRLSDAEDSHRRYVRLHADDARAHCDLADVLIALERYDEALASAGKAATLSPRAFLAAFTAGLACSMLQRFAEAQQWFAAAREADAVGFARFLSIRLGAANLDRDLDPRAIYLIREFDHLYICDWGRRTEYIAKFGAFVDEGVDAPPLMLRSLSLPLSPLVRRRLADRVAARISREAPSSAPPVVPRGERVRVGYVSPDLRTHPVGMLSAPLFRLHDRERFEVHAFALEAGDDSPWRREIEANAEVFHSLDARDLPGILAAIRSAQIDVLVDLAGMTTGALPEVFAARAAPVQVAYLGFPGTAGAGLIDYLICDSTCVPNDEDDGYGEALARLPSTFWICEPWARPAQRPSRAQYGLPDGAFVLYAHHPGHKITPDVFTAWAEILKRLPQATLWLLEDAPEMKRNLLREAAARGINEKRLIFAPRVSLAEYRARIGVADLALDTPTYNGGATTLDALLAGVPVLSCPSPGFAGRMAASALQAVGLGDLAVANLRAYVEVAVRIATDDALRKQLAARAGASSESALCDAARRTRELETAFEHMLALAAKGEAPQSFSVGATST